MNRSIAERLVHQRMRNRLHEAKAPIGYAREVEKILNYRLGDYETGVTIEDTEVLAETSDTITIRVEYSVDVRIPTYKEEDGSTHYEDNQEYRTQTITLKKNDLKENSDYHLGDEINYKGKPYTIIKQRGDSCVLRPSSKVDDNSFNGEGDSYEDIHLDKYQLSKYKNVDEATNNPDRVKLKYWIDVWNMIDKYGIEDWEDHDKYISMSRESFQKMLNGSKNKAYIQNLLLREDLTLDDDPEETDQQYSSAATSINSAKLPALFNMVDFEEGSINLDYGGGRFDNVAEYLEKEYGATNLVYDKYNRSADHNREVLNKIRQNGGADTVTCSNVLNVIAEESERLAVLRNCKRYLKSGGTCYITVYEGNGTGEGAPTKSGYQLNRKTKDYESEIKQVFPGAVRKGKLFICR